MVAERQKLRQVASGSRVGDVAVERARLTQEREEARKAGEWEVLKAAERRLEELDREAAAQPHANVTSTHKPLLAPSKARLGTFNPVRRRAQHQQTVSASASAEPLGQFRLVPPRRVPELVLRAKVTPGYAEIMAANGGFDMSFIAE
ncbi:hypothetical protein LPJ73_007703 [Coemansia sp. RSA 2703]|nr:hypothetical protein LPJ73_007703 [Coemansia sp. RSA 2703]KAJ2372436.1 hypothetical protein GGI05_007635 [Coemansia sp. RSA 2603]